MLFNQCNSSCSSYNLVVKETFFPLRSLPVTGTMQRTLSHEDGRITAFTN